MQYTEWGDYGRLVQGIVCCSAYLPRILYYHVPDGNDVADAAEEDEEMEDGMHEALLVETVEDGTSDVGNTFGYYPWDGGGADTVEKGLEGYKDRQTHAHKTKGFEITVLLEMAKTDYGAGYGA